MTWRPATVVDIVDESSTARTITLDVERWVGHRPGQHVDLRLTSADGYSAVRPYSIATPADGSRIAITVMLTEGGEVSSYLVSETEIGTTMEVRGPLGGWFVWDKRDTAPVQLVGGGVGVAPLMAMLREHDRLVDAHPMRLLYSTRSPDTLLFAAELARRAQVVDAVSTASVLYTRVSPDGAARPASRIGRSDLATYALPPLPRTRCFVCGSTGFVETAIELLLEAGFPADNIRAERFGP